jgi:hypothetical protein
MNGLVEFGSVAWAEAAERVLAEVASEYGAKLAGQSWTIVDVYTGAPASLGGPRIVFGFGLRDGAGFAALGDRAPAHMRMQMPFEAARVGAKAILGVSAGDIAARDERRRAAVAAGALAVEGGLDEAPLAVREAFAEWHNRLAKLIA